MDVAPRGRRCAEEQRVTGCCRDAQACPGAGRRCVCTHCGIVRDAKMPCRRAEGLWRQHGFLIAAPHTWCALMTTIPRPVRPINGSTTKPHMLTTTSILLHAQTAHARVLRAACSLRRKSVMCSEKAKPTQSCECYNQVELTASQWCSWHFDPVSGFARCRPPPPPPHAAAAVPPSKVATCGRAATGAAAANASRASLRRFGAAVQVAAHEAGQLAHVVAHGPEVNARPAGVAGGSGCGDIYAMATRLGRGLHARHLHVTKTHRRARNPPSKRARRLAMPPLT